MGGKVVHGLMMSIAGIIILVGLFIFAMALLKLGR